MAKNEGYRGWMEDSADEERGPGGGEQGGKAGGGKRKTVSEAMRKAREDAGDNTLDARLRRRLAEVLSDAGVGGGRVAIEVLYLLPPEFVRGYTDLFHRALDASDGGMGGRNDAKAALGKAVGKRTEAGPGSAKRSGKNRGVFPVRNDKALGEKDRIDRALRKLARSMRDGGGADTGKMLVSRCGEDPRTGEVDEAGGVGSCGKWVETGWRFCPNCGRKQP